MIGARRSVARIRFVRIALRVVTEVFLLTASTSAAVSEVRTASSALVVAAVIGQSVLFGLDWLVNLRCTSPSAEMTYIPTYASDMEDVRLPRGPGRLRRLLDCLTRVLPPLSSYAMSLLNTSSSSFFFSPTTFVCKHVLGTQHPSRFPCSPEYGISTTAACKGHSRLQLIRRPQKLLHVIRMKITGAVDEVHCKEPPVSLWSHPDD